jgi:dTDP-4-amino-4,6-dideoxygalactose transaminase
MDLQTKHQRLRATISGYKSALICFSGGVDSTLLLRVARDVLGERCAALTTVSATMARSERIAATTLAAELGVRHEVIESAELSRPGFAQNPADRCYHCKAELLEIARAKGIRVIADAATAAGSCYKGRPVGSLGDATSFSFYVIKNMTTGQGGIVTTNDADLAERVRALRNHGLDSNAWRRYSAAGTPFYTVSEPGFNYGMNDLQAALGLGQLARLGEFNAKRARLAQRYTDGFAAIPEIETPSLRPEVTSNWHLYVIRLRGLRISRDDFIEELRRRGIGTAVHYLPVHYHPYYKEKFGFRKGECPVAEAEFERLVSLPLFPLMSESDVDRVVDAVGEIVAEHRAPS